jgi:hypothetical protein
MAKSSLAALLLRALPSCVADRRHFVNEDGCYKKTFYPSEDYASALILCSGIVRQQKQNMLSQSCHTPRIGKTLCGRQAWLLYPTLIVEATNDLEVREHSRNHFGSCYGVI